MASHVFDNICHFKRMETALIAKEEFLRLRRSRKIGRQMANYLYAKLKLILWELKA